MDIFLESVEGICDSFRDPLGTDPSFSIELGWKSDEFQQWCGGEPVKFLAVTFLPRVPLGGAILDETQPHVMQKRYLYHVTPNRVFFLSAALEKARGANFSKLRQHNLQKKRLSSLFTFL